MQKKQDCCQHPANEVFFHAQSSSPSSFCHYKISDELHVKSLEIHTTNPLGMSIILSMALQLLFELVSKMQRFFMTAGSWAEADTFLHEENSEIIASPTRITRTYTCWSLSVNMDQSWKWLCLFRFLEQYADTGKWKLFSCICTFFSQQIKWMEIRQLRKLQESKKIPNPTTKSRI